MKTVFFCILITACSLFSQDQVVISGNKYLLFSGKVYSAIDGKIPWTVAPEWPTWTSISRLGKVGPIRWDGSNLYRLTYSGKDESLFVERGTLTRNGKGDARWYWQNPVSIPPLSGLLAGYADAVILDTRVPSGEKGKRDKCKVIWKDLLTGIQKDLVEFPFPEVAGSRTVLIDGVAHVFMPEGRAFRVHMLDGALEELTESFWKELGLTLYSEGTEHTGEPNPFLFGVPFFDTDQRIVLPVVIDVALDQEDIQRAWGKLPQEKRDKARALGFFPGTKKPVGWKGQVHFIAFDPTMKRWELLPRERFLDLVLVQDMNCLTERFHDMEADQIYVTEGGPIRIWHPPIETPITPTANVVPMGQPKAPVLGPLPSKKHK